MALIAVRDEENALDIVQETMITFVRKYREHPEEEWQPLFQRVLQSRITDAVRRETVRERFRVWFGIAGDYSEGSATDPIQEFPIVLPRISYLDLKAGGFQLHWTRPCSSSPFASNRHFFSVSGKSLTWRKRQE